MKNAVLMVAYNNLELTKEAVKSVMAQDIGPLHLWIVNNGSTDETREWLDTLRLESPSVLTCHHVASNTSPVKIVNREMATLFSLGYDKVFGVPNDVVLPPSTLREFSKWPRGIVTGSMNQSRDFGVPETATALSTCTPMAVAMIRRWVYRALMDKDGYFLDPGFFHYASDMDFALRIAACGITGIQLDWPYYHFGSASHRLATKEDGDRMRQQADRDREYFKQKYGFSVTDPEYGQRCGDINFRGRDGRV